MSASVKFLNKRTALSREACQQNTGLDDDRLTAFLERKLIPRTLIEPRPGTHAAWVLNLKGTQRHARTVAEIVSALLELYVTAKDDAAVEMSAGVPLREMLSPTPADADVAEDAPMDADAPPMDAGTLMDADAPPMDADAPMDAGAPSTVDAPPIATATAAGEPPQRTTSSGITPGLGGVVDDDDDICDSWRKRRTPSTPSTPNTRKRARKQLHPRRLRLPGGG